MGQETAKAETGAILDNSAAAGAPLISVVIPHYNDLDNLRLCLSLLERQTLPRNRFEIVVADNNSACGIEAVADLCGPGVKVVSAPIQGAAGARNAALEVARGAIYAFIDSDCRPALNWLEEGLKALEGTDVVGGRVDVDFANPARPNAIEAFEAVFAFDFKRYIEQEGFTGTGNMFVRRATFERVGTVPQRPFRGHGLEPAGHGDRRQNQLLRPGRRQPSGAKELGGSGPKDAARRT